MAEYNNYIQTNTDNNQMMLDDVIDYQPKATYITNDKEEDLGFTFEHQNKNLDKMLDYITFSDSEDENPKEKGVKELKIDAETYQREMKKLDRLYQQDVPNDEDDGGTMNTYTGTKNEKNEMDRKDIPIPMDLQVNDNLIECGTITAIVEGKVLFSQKSLSIINRVLNLDNIIYNDNKQPIGYIDDVFGQVDSPIYVVRIYPNLLEIGFNNKVGDALFYCERFVKFIDSTDLLRHKGCDASNAYDEEVSEGEMDFSDDEEEKQHKRERKKNKRFKLNDKGDFIQGINTTTHNNNNISTNKKYGVVNSEYCISNTNTHNDINNNNNDNNKNNNNDNNVNLFNDMIEQLMNQNINPFQKMGD